MLGRCEYGKDDYSLNIVNPPIYEEDDYDYKHHTMFYDTIMYPIITGLKYIKGLYYDCISWLEMMWWGIRYKFKKAKIRKSRKSSV